MSEYEAGVCNIGKIEQRKRYTLGVAGASATLVLVTLMQQGFVGQLGLIGILITSFAAFEGLLQGYMTFCASFALKGVYDVSDSAGDGRQEVKDEESKEKDISKAKRIHIYSVMGAITTTLVLYLALMAI